MPFTPEVQDAIAIARLDQSGLSDFLSGRIDEAEFANAIAEIWAAAPVVSETTGAQGATVAPGASYYQSYGKRPGITPEQILAVLRTVRARAE